MQYISFFDVKKFLKSKQFLVHNNSEHFQGYVYPVVTVTKGYSRNAYQKIYNLDEVTARIKVFPKRDPPIFRNF